MMTTLTVNTHEFEAIYRILITSTCDSIGEQRNLNDVLEAFEVAGYALDAASANGVPRMYSVKKDAAIGLTRVAADTLSDHINRGIGRFQSWSVRCLPAVLDRIEQTTKEA
jgi:hypothetical protein|tara:strand:- start:117 stop:449 length:333 start_codon:yes stop_codon:yes gene_type:complete